MKKFNSNKVLLLLLATVFMVSSSKSNKSVSTLTGWEYNNPNMVDFKRTQIIVN